MRLTTNEQGERVMQYNPSIETIDDAKVDLVCAYKDMLDARLADIPNTDFEYFEQLKRKMLKALVLSTNYEEYEGDE